MGCLTFECVYEFILMVPLLYRENTAKSTHPLPDIHKWTM